jgi:hypothetical protein
LKRGPAQPEADEFIRKRMFPLSQLLRMVMNGSIRDGKTIAGVLWLAEMLGQHNTEPRRTQRSPSARQLAAQGAGLAKK